MNWKRFLLLVLVSLPALALPAADGEQGALQAGYTLYYQGDLVGAYRHFRALADRDPNDVAAAYGVVAALYARDLTEDSLEEEFERRTEQLIERAGARYDKNENDLEALFYLAQTHGLRAGYRFQRQKSLLGAVGDASKSKKYSETYVQKHPGHADAYIALGLYNYYSDLAPAVLKFLRVLLFIPGGNRELGLEQLRRAAREGEMWSPQARMELVQIYTWLEGRIEEGLRLAEDLHRTYPDNPELSFRLARLYAGPVLEEPERAAAQYLHVLQQAEDGHPNYTPAVRYQALLGLADTRAQQWQLEEAIALLDPVIDTRLANPSWALPRALLARARYRTILNDSRSEEDAQQVLYNPRWKKWHKDADQLITKIRRRNGSGEAVRFADLVPGNRLVAEGRWILARKFYQQQHRDHPDDWQVRYRLARLDYLQGRTLAAEQQLRAVVKGDRLPREVRAEALLTLARIYDSRGDRKKALSLYEKVIDAFENEPAGLAARLGLLRPYKRIQLASG